MAININREFELQNDLTNIFNYFKSWNYLLSSYKESKRKDILIKSANQHAELTNFDQVEVIINSTTNPIRHSIYDIEIVPLKSISMKTKIELLGNKNEQKPDDNSLIPVLKTQILFTKNNSTTRVIEKTITENSNPMFNFFL